MVRSLYGRVRARPSLRIYPWRRVRPNEGRNDSARTYMDLNKTQQLDLLYFMRLTRSLEDRLDNLYKQGKIVGVCSSLGQEGTPLRWPALDKNQGDIRLL